MKHKQILSFYFDSFLNSEIINKQTNSWNYIHTDRQNIIQIQLYMYNSIKELKRKKHRKKNPSMLDGKQQHLYCLVTIQQHQYYNIVRYIISLFGIWIENFLHFLCNFTTTACVCCMCYLKHATHSIRLFVFTRRTNIRLF